MWKLTSTSILSVFLVWLAIVSADSQNSIFTMNITCPDGWQQAFNNCYYFNNEAQVTWQEARMECAAKNADLMVIGSSKELGFVSVNTEDFRTDEWWIGLAYNGGWDWVQYGGDKTQINWRNEPDNYDEQDCMALNEFGLFSDEYCSSKLGFICRFTKQAHCGSVGANNWIGSANYCYYVSPLLNTSLHLPWSEAKTYCANLLPGQNGQLLSLKNESKIIIDNLKTIIANFDLQGVLLPWWTGLNDLQTEGTYVWQDGSLADGSIINWDKAPSTDRKKQRNCGVMYQGGSVDDMKCDKRAHYVCEMTALQGHLNLGCGSWLRGGNSCYVLANDKGYKRSEAKSMCAKANAKLLKIGNLDEKMWVENLNLGGIGYWTGLTRGPNKAWIWDDQTVANTDYINWSQEPNNHGGNEDCVEIHRDGLYNDRICSAKTGYICEYPNSGHPCQAGWTACKTSCFYISPPNNSFAVNWFEAQQACSDMVSGVQAYRLAVNNAAEQSCINTALQQQPEGAPGYWTDLNDINIKGFWQFHASFNNPPNSDVLPWVHEPNNANGNENCAVMYNGGYYNDLNCEAKAFYICEKLTYSLSSDASSWLRTSFYLQNIIMFYITIWFI